MKKVMGFVFLFGVAWAQTLSVIKTSTILDGRGHILKDKVLMINGNRIVAILNARGNPTYDLSGLTVMPGWIDTHVHLGWHFNKDERLEQGGRGSKETPEQSALYAEGNAYATLMGGFTTVQSVGSAIDGDLRDLINAGAIPGPRIITSLRSVNENTGDAEKIRAYVRKMKDDG